MSFLWQDLRFGIRLLAKSPLFTVLAAASLALGIGANAAIFSFVNVVLLKPLNVSEPDRMVSIFSSSPNSDRYFSNSYPDFQDYRQRNIVFENLAVSTLSPLGISGSGGSPEVVLGQVVSGGYFEVLGVPPLLGRTFPAEERISEGSLPEAILSHAAWRDRFASDPQVLGRELRVNGYPFTVVGVMPEGFQALQIGLKPAVWVPLAMHQHVMPYAVSLQRRGNHFLEMIGRLKPTLTIEQARSNMETIAASLAEEYPDSNTGRGVRLVPADHNRAFLTMID